MTETFDILIRKGRHLLVDLRGFHLPAGHITFLFGESGIGKSLTGKAIFGLLDPDQLDVSVNGVPLPAYLNRRETHTRREHGFFVFQEPSTHLNPLMMLDEQMREGSLSACDPAPALEKLWTGAAPQDLRALLAVYPQPHRPSGGEKQRILCAMAFMKMDQMTGQGEGLFVFDEPTGSLDNRFRDVVLEMIAERCRIRRHTVLLVTHDYSMISVVLQRFPDLLDRIDFRELALTSEGLRVREFSPDIYVSWLSSQRPVATLAAGQRKRPVLTIEPEVAVHGRHLVISRTPGAVASDLAVHDSSMSYLKAPSGTGKTTVAKLLMGLARGTRFRAVLAGRTLTERTLRRVWQEEIWGRRATMVFQHADEALNLRARVRDIFEGLPGRNRSRAEIEAALLEFFAGEPVGRFMDRRVGSLSGGQKQRLNLLRSLLLDTDLVILDEPLNGLDLASMQKVLSLVRERLERGTAILVISHNEEIFDALIPRENVYWLSVTGGGASPVDSSRA